MLELSDISNANALDLTVVDQAIAAADSAIDSYLGKRFAVPLASVPAVISNLSAYWAARVLRRNRYSGQPMHDDNDQEAVDREWLRGVATGEISLGIDPPPTKSSIVTDRADVRDSTKLVSRDRTRGFW